MKINPAVPLYVGRLQSVRAIYVAILLQVRRYAKQRNLAASPTLLTVQATAGASLSFVACVESVDS